MDKPIPQFKECKACNQYLVPHNDVWYCDNPSCTAEYGVRLIQPEKYLGVAKALTQSIGYPLYRMHDAVMLVKELEKTLLVKEERIKALQEDISKERNKSFMKRLFGNNG